MLIQLVVQDVKTGVSEQNKFTNYLECTEFCNIDNMVSKKKNYVRKSSI
jgi:hypothetical protein